MLITEKNLFNCPSQIVKQFNVELQYLLSYLLELRQSLTVKKCVLIWNGLQQ